MVRVPLHYEPTRAAIEAGKAVYTEWPLGRTTAEAEELAALARTKGVQTAVGLQARVSPALLYMKEQIEAGYVGEVLSCHATAMRDGALARPSSRTWQRDASLGANYAHRDYFHGLGADLPEGRADLRPIQTPHLSAVYRSTSTSQLKVAFSVPIENGLRGDRRGVVGVLAMTVLPRSISAQRRR